MSTEKTLIELGYKKYRHEPTGFEGWSKEDLCQVSKEWYLIN